MIQFPELDLKNTKIRIILFFLAMLFLFISNFSTNNLLSIVVILLLINQFSEVKEKIYNHVIKKQEKIAVRYNNKIDDLLQKIKKFRKFSPQSYKSGYHFWKRFIQEITILENQKYIDALEFHEFTNSKRLKEISRLSKELYSEGYHILHELSLRYNKQWIKNPSIHNKEIVIDYPLPHDREKDRYYDFFL